MKGSRHGGFWLGVGLLVATLAGGGAAFAAEGLNATYGCSQLKQYLVGTAQRGVRLQLGQDHLRVSTGVDMNLVGGALPPSQVEGELEFGSSVGGGEPDHSTTNVQEVGVDEPDIVKTDGNFIYVLSGSHLLILDSWPVAQTAEVSRVELMGHPAGLFVQGDIAVAISSEWGYSGVDTRMVAPLPGVGTTRVSLFDITNRAAPRLMRELALEGDYSTARLVDGLLHLVVGGHLPVYNFIPSPYASSAPLLWGMEVQSIADRLAVRRYGKKLARLSVDQLVPGYQDQRHEAAGVVTEVAPISDCTDFYLPPEPNGTGTISVITLNLADPMGELRTATVVGDHGEVYASADNLYVVSINAGVWFWQNPSASGPRDHSLIHKFRLGEAPEYLASGEVPGWIVNRYALGEAPGVDGAPGSEVLRIATTENMWDWQGGDGPENRLFTLVQAGDRLEVLATLEGLGHEGERIYAVRYDGDRGYVVTFRQTDPLYTLDLSDPAAPRVVGELEIPGFSTYLHPIGGGYLLAIGQNTDQGGADLSLFDVRDPATPTLVDREWLGENTWSEAMYEPKAFTYFAPLGQLVVPVEQWWTEETQDAGISQVGGYFAGSLVFDLDLDAGFTPIARVDHSDFAEEEDAWGYYGAVRRNLYIGDAGGYALFSISDHGVKANDAQTWAELARVELPGAEYWGLMPY